MDMWYFARICAHARSWHQIAKCRFAHFPSFFSVHFDTYVNSTPIRVGVTVGISGWKSGVCRHLGHSVRTIGYQPFIG